MDRITEQQITDGYIKILSPLEFQFQASKNKDEVHVVDLVEYEGSGSCTCPHFICRIASRLEDPDGDIEPHEKDSQCKHIILARLIIADRFVKGTIENLYK